MGNGWITTGKRLPSEEGDVLLTTEEHLVVIGYWDGFYWHYREQYHLKDEVIAWMKLPDAYYEEETK